jgi:hypothetical protein
MIPLCYITIFSIFDLCLVSPFATNVRYEEYDKEGKGAGMTG